MNSLSYNKKLTWQDMVTSSMATLIFRSNQLFILIELNVHSTI